jgi:hypothetical protein
VIVAIVAITLQTDSVAHWNCFVEFIIFGSLHSDVSVVNEIGAEGAKALGDALKDNTTLSSLSPNLQGEWLLVSVQNSAPILLEGSWILFSTTFPENDTGQQVGV